MTYKVATTSPDINLDNLAKLRSVFPQFIRDNKVDFDALQAFMQKEGMLTGEEKYGLSWSGKSDAFRAIRTSSTGTLIPQKSESKNWDETENIFIEGDNLEVLKLLQTHYTNPGKIKMIYIDPPYNTGKDFVYKDNFHENVADYYERTGQTQDGIKTTANTEKNGRYHSDWLTMMYPRLFLARNLLRDDGVIFISIDDNEVANLRLIMDEMFGEENFISQLVWEKKKKGAFLADKITNIKEYVLVYAKNNMLFSGLIGEIKTDLETYPCINEGNKREIRTIPSGIKSKYAKKDYLLKKGETISANTMNMVLKSDLVIKDNILSKPLIIEGNWRYDQNSMEEYAKKKELYITTDLYLRRIVTEPRKKRLKDLLLKKNKAKVELVVDNLGATTWGTNEDAMEELNVLMEKKNIMDYPKPVILITKLLASLRDKNATVLDFFAGSGTTAHAVMDLNAEDGGNRRCISVQLPELTDEKSEAYKAGYKNIADIARERIRRAGEKIGKGDIGFKSYKLSSSNYRRWHNLTDSNTQDDLLKQTKLFLDKPLVDDYQEEDVVYEILVKEGFDLNSEISTGQEGKISYYTVQDGDRQLVVTFASELSQYDISSLKLSPDTAFVCLDSALDDTTKVNIGKTSKLKVI